MSQVFKNKPDADILDKLLCCFGCNEITKEFYFRKKDLELIDTVGMVQKLVPELSEYYHPYKIETYLYNLTITKCITILRHFLRQMGYMLYSKERYTNGEKFIQYSFNKEGGGGMYKRGNVTLKI